VKAVVFDFDGTLIDSSGHILEAFEYALSPFGITVTDQTIEMIRPRTTPNLFIDLIDRSDWPLAFERLAKITKEHLLQITLYDGMLELLEKLYQKGLLLAIWTGRDTSSAIDILKRLQLGHFFKIVVGNTCVKHNKPHPEGLLKIISDFGCNASEVVMVGDHLHDLEGAAAVGAKKVLVNHGCTSREVEKKYGVERVMPDRFVGNAKELENYLFLLL